MALNPYTLYNLYNKGILEYVPTDLLAPTPMGAMTQMSNPYIDMAKQGGLYHNHGAFSDSFQFSGVQSPYVQNYQTYGNIGSSAPQIGSLSNAGGMNTFNGYGVGALNPHTTAGAFGFNSTIGANNPMNTYNTFNGIGVGAKSPAGIESMFGGFAGTRNNLANGFNKTMAVINNTPNVILGALGGVLGVWALMHAFKRGKKPANKQSFWSNLNPMNWRLFKKSK